MMLCVVFDALSEPGKHADGRRAGAYNINLFWVKQNNFKQVCRVGEGLYFCRFTPT